MSYCPSRFRTIRRHTVEVKVGAVAIGGANPIRIQSMTTTDTQDVDATVRQSIALAEVGCEIVRVTAPNIAAAKCLRDIRTKFSAAGFDHIPLVADIHFLPSAAMEAVEHVEKVRVNPGNYADKKRFTVREYSDSEYDSELQRLHEAFSPLVKRSRELGRALRIGTNHGSLSDRIMNRYGDSPLGMVESALEFLRIAEDNDFDQLVLSMKASNPKVMIQAYRLLVDRMAKENMHYPLHLGVTEAGDGEDGRIKGAIGIGSLLLDGLGDTIRVSLTEDSVYEIPVARAIADKAMSLWKPEAPPASVESDGINPYQYTRRPVAPIELARGINLGPEQPPRVIVQTSAAELGAPGAPLLGASLKDTPAEGLMVALTSPADVETLGSALKSRPLGSRFLVLATGEAIAPDAVAALVSLAPSMVLRQFKAGDSASLQTWAGFARSHRCILACDTTAAAVAALAPTLRSLGDAGLVFTCSGDTTAGHGIGAYRALARELLALQLEAPIWIRNTAAIAVRPENGFLSKLLEASFLTGSLLCDGIGDLVSIETESDAVRSTRLAYNVLQGAGVRVSKTEYVACPSCGRTLFDLQTTTQRIREKTGHLKGVKLAIMGYIVNGPGEMADADFGYVGGAPGKINLYVGKNCVQYNIPQADADARLIALIKEHGKWIEPAPAAAAGS